MNIKFIIFIFLSLTSLNTISEIPRDAISNLYQLNDAQIIDKLSGYKAFVTIDEVHEGERVIVQIEDIHNSDGSFFMSIPSYDYSESGYWITKNNKLCYKTPSDRLYQCVYLFEGSKNDEKKTYFSHTQNGDFYATIDRIENLIDEPSTNSDNEGDSSVLAGESSDAREQFLLGYKYYNGDGVEKDFREAAKLWELSAEQGYANAQYELGWSYWEGEGVNKDDAISYMWMAVSQTEFFIMNGQPIGVNNSHRKKEYMMESDRRVNAKDGLLYLHANIPSSSDLIKGTGLASACWRQQFKNCESNHITYSVESENKAKERGLPLCPEDDPSKMYQLKWDKCFGIGESEYGKYEGEFINGELHGNATFTYPSGDVYIGEYFQGRIEGQGIYSMVNGDKYEGMFRDYAFDGVGKYTYSDGKVEEGIWENSQLIESKKTNKSIPVEKEYVAIEIASIRKQPFDGFEEVETIPRGESVFVISKTEKNDWYLIKEIRKNFVGDEIGEILGYSSANSFLSLDEITSGSSNSNSKTYSNSPGNLLVNAYINYVIIKNMHLMREGYAVVYINDSQMKKVKNQMIEIEKILVNEFSLNEDLLWDIAMKKYDKDYSMIDLLESTGIYTEEGNRVGMIALLSFGAIADEVIGSSSIKDF